MLKKLLLGSDYPFTTPAQTIERLRGLNDMPRRTGLPAISEEGIEGIIHRDTLAILGIENRAAA